MLWDLTRDLGSKELIVKAQEHGVEDHQSLQLQAENRATLTRAVETSLGYLRSGYGLGLVGEASRPQESIRQVSKRVRSLLELYLGG